jgi:hypothetical protein
MQIDNYSIGVLHQEAAGCTFSTPCYVQWSVIYGSGSWTLTMEEERALAVFERKILRKMK